MRISVVTSPAPIVTVAEAKAWSRIDFPDDDALLGGMIRAATQWLDAPSGWLGRALGVQTLKMAFSARDWWCGRLRLWYPPIREVLKVEYLDGAGQVQELAETAWRLDGEAVVLAPGASWPGVSCAAEAVWVTYEVGHETVPEPIRQAIVMLVAHWYTSGREAASAGAMTEPPFAVSALVQPYRVLRV